MNNKGFTLIELIVTVAILAILVAVAVPSFSSIIENNKMVSARDSLINAFQYARTEAVTRNSSISICPSSNSTSCVATTNWSNGWIVFEDSASGSTPTVGSILRVYDGLTGFTANFIPNGSSATDDFFRYEPTGMLDTEVDYGQIDFCDPDSVAKPKVVFVGLTTGKETISPIPQAIQ